MGKFIARALDEKSEGPWSSLEWTPAWGACERARHSSLEVVGSNPTGPIYLIREIIERVLAIL